MAKSKDISTANNALTGMDTSIGDDKSSDSSFDLFMLNLHKQEKETIAADDRITRSRKILMEREYKDRLEQIDKMSATEEEKASALAKLNQELNAKTIELARKMEENLYKFSDKNIKRKMKAEQSRTLESGKVAMRQQMAEVAASDADMLHKIAMQKKLSDDIIVAGREQIKIEQDKRNLTVGILREKRKDGIITAEELNAQFNQISETFEAERKGHEENIDFINEQIAALEKQKESAEADGLDTYEIDKQIEKLEGNKAQEKSAMKTGDKERFKTEMLNNTMKAGFKSMTNGLKVLSDAMCKAVDEAIDSVGQYKSVLDARLQGTQSSYDDVAKTLKRSLAVSPYVKQTEVLKKLNDAVDKGIAYNVEQRAFLATMTDKIVATFDAFDANLMRIIRLQQADTTQARMGMEAQLLQFFNSTFSDNSYLTDGYDKVSEALVDANAQMTREMSIAFEYNVQKWLGSLASLGFSTNTISTIAEGINYLGSGNVQALAGNTQLQGLLAMSASRAGLSYSELLVKGIDDISVNTLLKSMVEYLAEIAEDDNAVVKAAYGDVFNFTQSDLRAIKNIATDGGATISNIYDSSMTYAQSVNELQNQLNQVGSRLSMTEMINNVFDNFLYTAGESIASDPVTAVMWKTLTMLEAVTGGIEIPFMNIYGFGLDLNMSLEQLLKTGIFGLSVLGNVGSMVTSLAGGGGLDLSDWQFDEYTSRGGQFTSTVGGVQSSTSGSRAITSSASSDTKKSAISSTEEDQEEQKKSSKENMKDEITAETIYKELFEKKTAVYTIDNPVNAKMDLVVAAANSVSSKATEIYSLLAALKRNDNSMNVYVTNIDKTPVASSPTSIKISNPGEIADPLAKAILGTVGNEENGEMHTISDLVNLLANGVIQVTDYSTLETLKDINKNLI